MEVFYNGAWGTVCDDWWGLKDAQVVCRGLGYGDALEATSRSTFGRGSGDIILDHVQCTGTEPSILKCLHQGFLQHNCDHTEDAGVICMNASNYFEDVTSTNGEKYSLK